METLGDRVAQIKKKNKNENFHGDLANSLIQLAVLKIAKSGSLDFTIRDLAKTLGVSHTATYRHFKSKQALVNAIALQGYLKLLVSFDKVNSNKDNLLENLGKAYIDFGIQNPGYYRVMFGMGMDKNPQEMLKEACTKSFYTLLDALGKRTDQNVKKAMLAWSVVHGWVLLCIDGQLNAPMKDFGISKNEIEFFLQDSISNLLKNK